VNIVILVFLLSIVAVAAAVVDSIRKFATVGSRIYSLLVVTSLSLLVWSVADLVPLARTKGEVSYVLAWMTSSNLLLSAFLWVRGLLNEKKQAEQNVA